MPELTVIGPADTALLPDGILYDVETVCEFTKNGPVFTNAPAELMRGIVPDAA